jgi:hypothetical protein
VPEVVRHLQQVGIQQYANAYMHPESPKRERLSEILQKVADTVAPKIDDVPGHTFAWPLPDYSAYLARFDPAPPSQTSKPSLGG